MYVRLVFLLTIGFADPSVSTVSANISLDGLFAYIPLRDIKFNQDFLTVDKNISLAPLIEAYSALQSLHSQSSRLCEDSPSSNITHFKVFSIPIKRHDQVSAFCKTKSMMVPEIRTLAAAREFHSLLKLHNLQRVVAGLNFTGGEEILFSSDGSRATDIVFPKVCPQNSKSSWSAYYFSHMVAQEFHWTYTLFPGLPLSPCPHANVAQNAQIYVPVCEFLPSTLPVVPQLHPFCSAVLANQRHDIANIRSHWLSLPGGRTHLQANSSRSARSVLSIAPKLHTVGPLLASNIPSLRNFITYGSALYSAGKSFYGMYKANHSPRKVTNHLRSMDILFDRFSNLSSFPLSTAWSLATPSVAVPSWQDVLRQNVAQFDGTVRYLHQHVSFWKILFSQTRQGVTPPSLFTSEDMTDLNIALAPHHMTILPRLSDIIPTIHPTETGYHAMFSVPLHDDAKEGTLFELIPLPRKTDLVYEPIPSCRYVISQRPLSRVACLTRDEMISCTKESFSCQTSSPFYSAGFLPTCGPPSLLGHPNDCSGQLVPSHSFPFFPPFGRSLTLNHSSLITRVPSHFILPSIQDSILPTHSLVQHPAVIYIGLCVFSIFLTLLCSFPFCWLYIRCRELPDLPLPNFPVLV